MLTMMKEPTVATVKVQTLLRGEVEVAEDQLVSFSTPLLGFERHKRFLLYQTETGPTYWLQSADELKVSFCLLAPFQAGLDPNFEIGPGDVSDIGALDEGDIDVYTLVVLDRDPNQRRTNLRAPILICRSTRRAKQVVLNDPNLPIKFYLRDLKPKGG